MAVSNVVALDTMTIGMATGEPETFPDLENASKWHPE
jgi:hypothetical protein